MLAQTVMSYERQFKYQVAVAQAYVQGAQRRVQTCRARIINQRGQLRAVDAALHNLNFHAKYDRACVVDSSLVHSARACVV